MLYLCKAEGAHPQASALLVLFVLMRTIQGVCKWFVAKAVQQDTAFRNILHLEKGFKNNTQSAKCKLTQGSAKAESVWDSILANQKLALPAGDLEANLTQLRSMQTIE